jgi:hypothetical protein
MVSCLTKTGRVVYCDLTATSGRALITRLCPKGDAGGEQPNKLWSDNSIFGS